MRKDKQQSDDDSSTETPADPEPQHILQEIRKKRCIDHVVNNNTMSAMEAQLHRLVKDVTDTIDATAKEMNKSSQEGFFEVRAKLDYVYNFFLNRHQKA